MNFIDCFTPCIVKNYAGFAVTGKLIIFVFVNPLQLKTFPLLIS